MRRAFRLCAATALATLMAAGHAQGPAEPTPAPPLAPLAVSCDPPATTGAARPDDAELDLLLARLPRCEHRADWLAAVGYLLNRAQRFAEAADMIERALMLDPELKAARVDYTLALAGSGDALAAQALLADILAEADVPPGLRAALQRQRGLLELAVEGGWFVSGWAGLRSGRDSNLAGAPDLDSLTLTLGGQLVEVLLDESYRRQPGSYRQAEAALALLHLAPGGARWQAGLSLRERQNPSVPRADSRQAELVLEHGAELPGTTGLRGYATVAAAALRSDLSDYTTRTLMLGIEPRWAIGCESRLGLEAQTRTYPSNPVLSGRYIGLSLSRGCDNGAESGNSSGQTLWSLRLGKDRAVQADRPGGAQWQAAARWATSQPHARLVPGAGGHWLLDAELSYQHDVKGYSPIIDSGRSRSVTRLAFRLEYRRPFMLGSGSVLEPALGIDAVGQHSNVPLFGLTNWGPYVSLRARW